LHERNGLPGFFLDCEGLNFIGAQGTAVAAIARLSSAVAPRPKLRLARVKTAVAVVLERDGVLEDLRP
jgi:hypothetical protein